MGTHERMAIAAVLRGLRLSGAIGDEAITAVADELAKAATEAQSFGNEAGYDQMVALADDVRAGRVTRHIPD